MHFHIFYIGRIPDKRTVNITAYFSFAADADGITNRLR